MAAAIANQKRYLEANAERINEARRRQYSLKPRAKRRDPNLARYGITDADYMEMLAAQGGKCAICLRPETSRGNNGQIKSLSVDHCHTTGHIRGLLCNNCNRAIGLLGDDLTTLVLAFEYLEQSARSSQEVIA